MLPSLDGKTQRIASAASAVAPPTTESGTVVSGATADSMPAVVLGRQRRAGSRLRGRPHARRDPAGHGRQLPGPPSCHSGKRPGGSPRRVRGSWVALRLLLISTDEDREVPWGGLAGGLFLPPGGDARRCRGARTRRAACLPKLPAGKRLVKLNLKPSTEIPDLVAWISSVTCKPFILPSGIASGKTVTVVSPS